MVYHGQEHGQSQISSDIQNIWTWGRVAGQRVVLQFVSQAYSLIYIYLLQIKVVWKSNYS